MRGTGELVLYLDYDGVLHHPDAPWGRHTLFQHAELLEQILAPHPAVQIVLATAWALRAGTAAAARHLRPALRSRVVGATYPTRMDRLQFASQSRGAQVWSDVLRRRPRDWLALDDDARGWPTGLLEKHIRTPARPGLSDPSAQQKLTAKLREMA